MSLCTIADLVQDFKDQDLVQSFEDAPERQVTCCSTCANSLTHNRLPSGLNLRCSYPIIDCPSVLEGMSQIEACLVALRVPFITFRRQFAKQWQQQLKGSIINVPNVWTAITQAFPARDTGMSVLEVNLKRRLADQHRHQCQNIDPGLLKRRLQYLLKQPLYESVGAHECAELHHMVHASVHDSSDQARTDVPPDGPQNTHQNAAQPEPMNVDHVGSESEMGADPNINAAGSDADDACDDSRDVDSDTAEQPPTDSVVLGEDFGLVLVDDVLDIAPAEGARPESILSNPHCEEMGFPSLFFGRGRPEGIAKDYSKLLRFELRHKSRRWATNIGNILPSL